MNTPRRSIWLLLIALTVGLLPAAAFDFPQPTPYDDTVEVADYLLRPVTPGIRAYWDGQRLLGEADMVYPAPAWFSADFPDMPMVGLLVDTRDNQEALSRIVRQPEAEEGWQRLQFIAIDLPQAAGGFRQRQEQLQQLVQTINVPALQVMAWQSLNSEETLQGALEAMYRDGGAGFILRHGEAAYRADGDYDLLLALPYEVGEVVVVRHNAGKGEYVGMMGSLEVADDDGNQFPIGSGFNFQQRRQPPPVGGRISYKYKGFTETGKPKNPVFLQQLPPAQKKIGGFLQASQLMWLFIGVMLLLTTADGLTHLPTGRRWNFKSAIVSVGLLGTFVGIWWGLYNFDTSDITASVPTLLEGLKLSFITSIIGIGLSTLLSVIQTVFGHTD